jgi:secondary thiamine-phosphate synthase enzyme
VTEPGRVLPAVTASAQMIETKAETKFGFVDLTTELIDAVCSSGIDTGLAIAFCRHTTCSLLINEWENGALEDLRRRGHKLVPDGIYYAHDDMKKRTQNLQPIGEPANGQAHVLQALVGGTSQLVPIVGGRPALGRWQRLILVELDDPRPREVVFTTIG